MERKFKFNLPDDLAQAISRRHNGANRTQLEIKEVYTKLQKLYKKYNKNKV